MADLTNEDRSVRLVASAARAPALILEQCFHIRALLKVSLRAQTELLAHLKGEDLQKTINRFAEDLNQVTLEIAREAKSLMEKQSPIE